MANETAALRDVSLDDKYEADGGHVFLSGTQALVRLPIMQRARDRLAGLRTAGFISGYRGSPLGGYDHALWQAQRFLAAAGIEFQPGLNEELAATAVWGSQQVSAMESANVEGVFGIWYGKGPGVDRSADALKHANAAGTSRHGGVLALAGDDHAAVSSTLAHQSEHIFQAAMMPILNPATVHDYLDFGLWGFALSRFSGCWIGFKAVSETVESSASVAIDALRPRIVEPEFEMPEGGLGLRWPDPPLAAERRLHVDRMLAVAAFARANPIDQLLVPAPRARLGVLTTGKAHLDALQAFEDLGLTEAALERLGIRLYKVGLSWPIEEHGALEFARGLDMVLVLEEKRGFVEDQLIRLLYNLDADERPAIVGKRDERGAPMLPSVGEYTPAMVATALVGRMRTLGMDTRLVDQHLARIEQLTGLPPETAGPPRTPYFCSGCPHNTSTVVPEGSRAMAGIGCHAMATYIPARNTAFITHMGGEGANWIGQAPFVSEPHVFQNLGDGTYAHSGTLAIRAAAAAGVNITYKILYNDAVAMTGGQPVEGQPGVVQIAQQVAAEGAKRIALVSDDIDKYRGVDGLPDLVTLHHRTALDEVQRELRELGGLTVLIFDQTCAAEKRRRRKRGQMADPPRRAFINDAVCEGCGDCSRASNCVSIKPLETPLGRKRFVDQSSCNKDMSCLNGFCPSFVTVEGGSVRKASQGVEAGAVDFDALPEPARALAEDRTDILVTGIGGTGVITVGALLGMAAHLEGKGCSVLDFTGLAQKNGAVMSHVRIFPDPSHLGSVRIGAGGARLVLGCDMIVAASAEAISRIEPGKTCGVVNSGVQPTAAFVLDTDFDLDEARVRKQLGDKLAKDSAFFDATALATRLMGDSIASNLMLVGYAYQKGLIPLGLESIERAIELNGVAPDWNRQALAWGRMAAHDPEAIARLLPEGAPAARTAPALDDTVEDRSARLRDYQDEDYADRYAAFVKSVERAERERVPGQTGLAAAVAEGLFKLMAYKDEYEVARLYTDGEFRRKLKQQFEGDFRIRLHLGAPILSRRDKRTGHLVKRSYGPWIFGALAVLSRLKRLRGTRFDIFGYSRERRMERRLIVEYRSRIEGLLDTLNAGNHATAVELARLPLRVRGFGHVKEQAVAETTRREAALLEQFASEPELVAAE